ncbi:MAG: dTDP-4-dehydrorhamnose 3,5-epimerase family protein [Collinsella sp.]
MLVFDLPVHGDSRGWFKENWQREKMRAGPARHGPVQNNISFNDQTGVTRGIHAEPWDKFISVRLRLACSARGRPAALMRSLRPRSAPASLDPSRAIYVPRGVGNPTRL